MSAVGQSHEGEEGPVIVDGWINAIFNAKPPFDLRPPTSRSVLRKVKNARANGPRVMKAHNANDGLEANSDPRNSHYAVFAWQKNTDAKGASVQTISCKDHAQF